VKKIVKPGPVACLLLEKSRILVFFARFFSLKRRDSECSAGEKSPPVVLRNTGSGGQFFLMGLRVFEGFPFHFLLEKHS
jgi:hypothetical protein